MKTNSLAQDNLSARLFLLLSRLSLVTALMIVMPLVVYLGGGGFTTTNSAPGPEYAELMRAVRSPLVYRLGTGSEALYWLMISGVMIIFAGLFARRAPIRAGFTAACGLAQLTGSLGGFLRLGGISDLAARYATAAPNQQAALLQSFLDLNRVVQPHYTSGTLLQGAGFLLVAWVVWRWKGFPSWLAVWLAVTGLLGLVLFVVLAAGSPVSLFLFLDVIALISVHLAMAARFWRPSSAMVSGVASASAAG